MAKIIKIQIQRAMNITKVIISFPCSIPSKDLTFNTKEVVEITCVQSPKTI